MVLIIVTFLLVLLVLLYKYAMDPYRTFEERGVAYSKPKPFLGNLNVRVLLGRKSFLKNIIEQNIALRHHKIYGFYNLREPFFILHDAELIKRVGIQDFEHFINHRPMIPETGETIFSKSLNGLKDDKWREMRNTLTPSFTGSKLKAMFELINECSIEGVRYIEAELLKANKREIDLEMKDYFGRFANDVIASASFGIKVNSFVDKNNQFYTLANSVMHFSFLSIIKVILYGIMPRVMKALRVKLFNGKKIDYFCSLVFDTMKYRKEHNIIRPDMIHLLMEAKRQYQQNETLNSSTKHAEFNDEDLLAQCLLIFLVGFEVMSASLCFLTYELCRNPDVQAKLYEEISAVEQELQGKPLSYNMLSKMKYMDLVICEALRMWPPAFSLDRMCGKDIDMYDENRELLAKFRKGDIIQIPIIALQRDPHNFPEPEVFKPERFLDENRANIKPFTYLPFGVGPRSCIDKSKMFLIICTLGIVLCALLYKWSVAKYQTFEQRGIPHEKPTPLLGNMRFKELFGLSPHLVRQIEQYQQFKDSKVYGAYFLRDPIFVLRDLELIKSVGVKQFDHFVNHSGSEQFQTLLSKSLVQLKDREWRDMRNILTPTFTGIKMRAMYDLINACSEVGVAYIEDQLKSANGNGIELEMKDYFTRFTNDVIASAAFGIKVNSFEEQKNKFFQLGQSVTTITAATMLKALLFTFMPKLMKSLGLSILDEKMINYFRSLVFDAIKFREKNSIIRPDMIHLLMEAQRKVNESEESNKKFTDDDLLAQCLLFFFAGFETVSTCLCFVTYELCMNPTVQQQLYEEILDVEQQLQGKPLDYDSLMHMKYMDMVVSEALRKWPPAPQTDRACNADIDLRDENNEIVVSLKKGDRIFIPIVGLHYDPEYFPEPKEFRPERFAEQNKEDIKPFTYMPFGVGPRSCIGNRMALMEVKSIIYHQLLKFELLPCKKTTLDMMNNIMGFQMAPKDKFWLKYVARKNETAN
ncbi:PREDICTED: probable cytochrome P450 9h1 [Drosophila arizonae]|uniref:Probable cytochrome P450 9h1 n=1 Tax=Drosophila arizonae TaxID=7263 RepID=A0ABM1PBK2_DROAR|nr:PREDICTED: probable cytochrome P450 9h1 [Drosophila arizonae]